MVVYSPKALATAALVIGFSSSAFGCLVITGKAYNPNTFGDGTITTTDNGVQTCNGEIGVGDKNVDCISGYSLNYDYTDNNEDGPMPITYCNPSNCYGIDVPLSCPHNGLACTFEFSTFCGKEMVLQAWDRQKST